MGFIRKKDYQIIIQDNELDVLTNSTDSLLDEMERAAVEEVKSYLRPKYNTDKAFQPILTYSHVTQYFEGDLIEWSETAYDESTTYNTGDRVSYSGYIYSSNEDGVTGTWDLSKWTQLAENESLYYNQVPALGQLPSTAFAYTSNQYTSNHDEILGWDRENNTTLYFKYYENNGEVRIYFSESDRTSDINVRGRFPYDREGLQPPITVEITPGGAPYNNLSGYIDIRGFMSDEDTWTVVASNYWIAGDNRNQLIKNIVLDIVLYHIHSRVQPRNIPDLRKERYDGIEAGQEKGAIGYLKKIAKGMVEVDLPSHFDKSKGLIYWTSEPKQNHSY